jgi:hypothetical protein
LDQSARHGELLLFAPFRPIDSFLLKELPGLAGFGDIFVCKNSRRENIRSGFLLSQT